MTITVQELINALLPYNCDATVDVYAFVGDCKESLDLRINGLSGPAHAATIHATLDKHDHAEPGDDEVIAALQCLAAHLGVDLDGGQDRQ